MVGVSTAIPTTQRLKNFSLLKQIYSTCSRILIMIELYYWTTPNGHKITMFLEEAELPYTIVPINIGAGDQFKPEFLKIAPNNRIPAIVDHEPTGGGDPISLFESGAILLYLAEKTGKLIPALLNRGMNQAGIGTSLNLR